MDHFQDVLGVISVGLQIIAIAIVLVSNGGDNDDKRDNDKPTKEE